MNLLLAATEWVASPVPLQHTAYLALALFAVGVIGVTCRRNILIVLLSVEIMLNSANLMLVTFSRAYGNLDGQVFVFFAMVVAAAEVAVGLAIVIALYRLRQSTNIDDADELAEADYGPVPPLALEGEDHHHDHDDHGHADHAEAAPEPAAAAVADDDGEVE